MLASQLNESRSVKRISAGSPRSDIFMSVISHLKQQRPIVITAFVIQLLAISTGLWILYSCTGRSPSLARDLSETAYWGTVGILGMMLIGAPVTVFVVSTVVLLIYCDVRWKKLRFLWVAGLLLWAALWILLAYDLCEVSSA